MCSSEKSLEVYRLRPDYEELSLELPPELQELMFTGGGDVIDAFISFIDARQDAGHPLTLARNPGFKAVILFRPCDHRQRAARQGIAAIFEPSTHTQSHRATHPTPTLYPRPSTLANYHAYWTHDVFKEDFAMSNTLQIYDILIDIYFHVVVCFLYPALPSRFLCHLGFTDHSLSYRTLR